MQQFLPYPPIYQAATEADAILPTIVIVAFAEIARVGAAATPVAYMQLASTMSASEKPYQKPLAGTNRSHRFVSLPVHGITPRHSSVLFVYGPSI